MPSNPSNPSNHASWTTCHAEDDTTQTQQGEQNESHLEGGIRIPRWGRLPDSKKTDVTWKHELLHLNQRVYISSYTAHVFLQSLYSIYILQGDKSLCFLGLVSTYQEHFGQQRIELGSSFYVASAGRSGFTLFWINKILTVSKRETRPPERTSSDRQLKDSRGKGCYILWCSTSITFILPVYIYIPICHIYIYTHIIYLYIVYIHVYTHAYGWNIEGTELAWYLLIAKQQLPLVKSPFPSETSSPATETSSISLAPIVHLWNIGRCFLVESSRYISEKSDILKISTPLVSLYWVPKTAWSFGDSRLYPPSAGKISSPTSFSGERRPQNVYYFTNPSNSSYCKGFAIWGPTFFGGDQKKGQSLLSTTSPIPS